MNEAEAVAGRGSIETLERNKDNRSLQQLSIWTSRCSWKYVTTSQLPVIYWDYFHPSSTDKKCLHSCFMHQKSGFALQFWIKEENHHAECSLDETHQCAHEVTQCNDLQLRQDRRNTNKKYHNQLRTCRQYRLVLRYFLPPSLLFLGINNFRGSSSNVLEIPYDLCSNKSDFKCCIHIFT